MKQCPLCLIEYPSSERFCAADGTLLVAQRELAPGTVFRDTYRIVRTLGRGGMGVVYLAEHMLLGQLRALKFLSPALATDPVSVQRFLREARRAAEIGLNNRNIVKTLDVGQDDGGGFFICMEYVEGPSLAVLMEQFPNGLQVERAIAIAKGVASGLEAAHSKGMVHRDIKPGNILLAREENGEEVAKIADFGIVTGTDDETKLTRIGSQPLTPEYASPEQWIGATLGRDLDGRTDLYALGCVLFEMLTGEPPFRGASAEELRSRHLSVAAPSVSSVRPDITRFPGLDGITSSLLKKKRTERPNTAQAVLAALAATPQAPSFANAPRPASINWGTSSRRAGFLVKLLAGLATVVLLISSAFLFIRWAETRALPWESDAAIATKAKGLYAAARFKEAIPLLERACKGGELESCDELGDAYQSGLVFGGPLDPMFAVTFYRRACDGGYMPGCEHSADSYFDGTGTKKDPIRGLFYYNKACDGGFSIACEVLGRIYSKGDAGIPVDFTRAAAYFRRGCDNGLGSSCIFQRGIDAEGKGVPKD